MLIVTIYVLETSVELEFLFIHLFAIELSYLLLNQIERYIIGFMLKSTIDTICYHHSSISCLCIADPFMCCGCE